MATKYLNEITSALNIAFPNSTTDISKMAWYGLADTNAFKWGQLSIIEQNNIKQVIWDNTTGNAGTTCN